MANEVEICNAALSLLGEDANIISVTEPDGSELSGLCARWYPMACRRLFEEYDWSFAQRRVKLSELSTIDATLYEAKHAYTFPSDAVRIIRIYERIDSKRIYWGNCIREAEWRTEYLPENSSRMILTDIENAVGHYTAYISSAALYPQYFVEALILLLASLLVGPVKRSSSANTEALNLLKQYSEALSRAKTADVQMRHQKHSRIPSSIYSRWV